MFRVGEDVVHAKLGEGVVTGVEPGGIVVVRFAGEAADRKLMADYAPDQKTMTTAGHPLRPTPIIQT